MLVMELAAFLEGLPAQNFVINTVVLCDITKCDDAFGNLIVVLLMLLQMFHASVYCVCYLQYGERSLSVLFCSLGCIRLYSCNDTVHWAFKQFLKLAYNQIILTLPTSFS